MIRLEAVKGDGDDFQFFKRGRKLKLNILENRNNEKATLKYWEKFC